MDEISKTKYSDITQDFNTTRDKYRETDKKHTNAISLTELGSL